MQAYMFVAGVLAIVVGLVHSVLGEILIFRHLRSGGLVPANRAPPLKERNIRILWATWHLASVFGWGFAIVLLRLASPDNHSSLQTLVMNVIVFAYLGGSLLVLIGTKGRHPGWIVLLAVAALTWLSANAA